MTTDALREAETEIRELLERDDARVRRFWRSEQYPHA
jgi:hypothetical protein